VNAVVRVAVATLWAEPVEGRPGDTDALGETVDIRAWCAGLDEKERLRTDVVTQLLLGERVLIEEERDGWARVVAVEQPAPGLDDRGYPGWLPRHQLVTDVPRGTSVLVSATATTLRDSPDGDLTLRGVVLGTRLHPLGMGPRRAGVTQPDGDWVAVGVPGEKAPAWARGLDLATAPAHPATPREVLLTATRLRDVRYVWGGLTPFGIDCSGLVHLAWRRHGVTLPRDAWQQAAAAKPLDLGTERPGDLYFFARGGAPAHHVGIVAAAPRNGTRVMLHACSKTGHVVVEEITGDAAATLVAAGRVA
jgi:cell wall-associated NlpC family hydrolase